MPDIEHPLVTVDALSKNAVELTLRPTLGEERTPQDDDAEGAVGEPVVDLPSQAVADAQLGLVQPDFEPSFSATMQGER